MKNVLFLLIFLYSFAFSYVTSETGFNSYVLGNKCNVSSSTTLTTTCAMGSYSVSYGYTTDGGIRYYQSIIPFLTPVYDENNQCITKQSQTVISYRDCQAPTNGASPCGGLIDDGQGTVYSCYDGVYEPVLNPTDGNYKVDANGNLELTCNDGYVVLNGSSCEVLPFGASGLDENGEPICADGFAPEYAFGEKFCTPTTANPDGSSTGSDGTIYYPDGSYTKDGVNYNPDGTITNFDGTTTNQDGTITNNPNSGYDGSGSGGVSGNNQIPQNEASNIPDSEPLPDGTGLTDNQYMEVLLSELIGNQRQDNKIMDETNLKSNQKLDIVNNNLSSVKNHLDGVNTQLSTLNDTSTNIDTGITNLSNQTETLNNLGADTSIVNPLDESDSFMSGVVGQYTSFYDNVKTDFDSVTTLADSSKILINEGFTSAIASSNTVNCPQTYEIDMSSLGTSNIVINMDICASTSTFKPFVYPILFTFFTFGLIFFTFNMLRSF